MFDTLLEDFEDRVREIDIYFQFLKAIDNDELSIVQGVGKQELPLGKPSDDWARMLKGAAHVVLYNLVEAFIRRGFQAVFETVEADQLCGSDLIDQFRLQWIEQRNRKTNAFDGSPKIYMTIANEIIHDVLAKRTAILHHEYLPVSGNINSDTVRSIFRRHGISLDIPDPDVAKGGETLTIVVNKRNSLSHGNESFVEVGRSLTANDLLQMKHDVVLYMRSVLQSLKTFADGKSYKR